MPFVFSIFCFIVAMTEGFPTQMAQAPPPSAAGHTLLVPVMVLGSNGPMLVLVPMSNTNWAGQKDPNPTPESTQMHTHTRPDQHHVKGQSVVPQNGNSEFLQAATLTSPSLTPETPPPQGQVAPVWNSLPAVVPLQPSVTGQRLFTSWLPTAGGAGGQTQVVSVVPQVGQSLSASSEEGDATQVIYVLPVTGEIPNLGIAEGGEEKTNPPQPEGLMPNPNPNPNPNPGLNPNIHVSNLGHLHPATPSPPAGHQENPASLGREPPSVTAGEGVSTGVLQGAVGSSGGLTADTTKPCSHTNRRASTQAPGA
ncbi:uncharacterized protein LOC143486813 [Brachyhypopomus gauderio]|uniref:uncharacterized protein LOC143486813 n=1 Tax=Brachyhypopomus gauderio TaxID=698409 RepID=UPI004041FC6A